MAKHLPPLEGTCPTCHGDRSYYDTFSSCTRRCETCNRTGVVITEEGEKLLAFLKKHWTDEDRS